MVTLFRFIRKKIKRNKINYIQSARQKTFLLRAEKKYIGVWDGSAAPHL